MWLYADLPQTLKGEPSSFVFSTDGTLISASAAALCGVSKTTDAGSWLANRMQIGKQDQAQMVLLRLTFIYAFDS